MTMFILRGILGLFLGVLFLSNSTNCYCLCTNKMKNIRHTVLHLSITFITFTFGCYCQISLTSFVLFSASSAAEQLSKLSQLAPPCDIENFFYPSKMSCTSYMVVSFGSTITKLIVRATKPISSVSILQQFQFDTGIRGGTSILARNVQYFNYRM